MSNTSLSQLLSAAESSPLALTWLAIEYIENAETNTSFEKGVELLQFAGDHKNVIWAKNIMAYLRYVRPLEQPITHHVLVESAALEQLRLYAEKGDMWAMLSLGHLLFTGFSNPRNEAEGASWLNRAADHGCLLAMELLMQYGITYDHQR